MIYVSLVSLVDITLFLLVVLVKLMAGRCLQPMIASLLMTKRNQRDVCGSTDF